jgi:hypothetical protein
LRLPEFLDIKLYTWRWSGCHPYTPAAVTHLLQAEVALGHSAVGRIKLIKVSQLLHRESNPQPSGLYHCATAVRFCKVVVNAVNTQTSYKLCAISESLNKNR